MIPPIYLHLIPTFEQSYPQSCHIHLSTATHIEGLFQLTTKQTYFEKKIVLNPHNRQTIHQIPWKYFNDKPRFSLHFAHDITAIYTPQPKECIRVLQHTTPSHQEWKIAMHQKIKNTYTKELSLPSFRIQTPPPIPSLIHHYPPPSKNKIDLHIGKDVSYEDAEKLGPLDAQMQVFEKHFWRYHTHNQTFTVIHGKGTGKLRANIREFLTHQGLSAHLYEHQDGGSTTIIF